MTGRLAGMLPTAGDYVQDDTGTFTADLLAIGDDGIAIVEIVTPARHAGEHMRIDVRHLKEDV